MSKAIRAFLAVAFSVMLASAPSVATATDYGYCGHGSSVHQVNQSVKHWTYYQSETVIQWNQHYHRYWHRFQIFDGDGHYTWSNEGYFYKMCYF